MTATSDTPESFLSRWSRLKRAGTAAEEPATPPPTAEAEPPPAPAAAAAAPEPEPEPEETAPPPGLPPVDSLTAESDFTPFLRAGVPEDLHRQALRRLWTSDPIYANDDGLKDYADDYTGLFSGTGAVRTLYRVGQGFLDAVDEAAEQAEQDARTVQETAENTEDPPPTDMRGDA